MFGVFLFLFSIYRVSIFIRLSLSSSSSLRPLLYIHHFPPTMGRKKISIKPIAHPSTRRATFEKRRIGLLKKAMELSILCKSTVSLTIYTSEGDVYIYASEPYENVVQKFQNYRGPYRLLTNDHLAQLIPGKSASNSIGFEIIKQPHSAATAVSSDGNPAMPSPVNPQFVMPSIQSQTTESNTTDSVTPITHSMATNSNSSSSKELSPPPPAMGHHAVADGYSPHHHSRRNSSSEFYRYNPMAHGHGPGHPLPQPHAVGHGHGYRGPPAPSAYYGYGAYPQSPRRHPPSPYRQGRAYSERSNIHDFVAPIHGSGAAESGEIQIKQDPYNVVVQQQPGNGQDHHSAEMVMASAEAAGTGPGDEQRKEQMSTESTSEPKSKESSLDKPFTGNGMHSEMMIDDLVPDFDLHGMFDDEGPHDLVGNMSSPFLQ